MRTATSGLEPTHTLRSLILGHPLPLEQIIDVGRAICDLLGTLADEGRVPCRLAPDGILVGGSSDRVDLRIVTGQGSEGGLDYTSPEVREGQPPDRRAAVWLAGVLLYELVTGKPPWDEPAASGKGGTIPSIADARSDLPGDVELTIYRMLDPDPDLRLQGCGIAKTAILRALRDQLDGVSSRASIPSSTRAVSTGIGSLLWSTQFIGRDAEMAEAVRLLSASSCRLLTVIGPGGVGKSRLAFHAAERLSGAFAHGVYIVPLGGVIVPEFIVLAIGSALEVPFFGSREPVRQLIDLLKEKSILLILDDFDRVLDGAGLVSTILAGTRDLRIMVTSRSRLNLSEEVLLPLSGLGFPEHPDASDAGGYDAVRLFREHARRLGADDCVTDADLPSVVRICQILDGVPLAIEHAARWVRTLPCTEIAREISRDISLLSSDTRDVMAHHRSMGAVFERSWRALPEPHRGVMARASVFQGGFRRDAAQEVAGLGLPVLAQMIDRSLIQRSGPLRYQIHHLLGVFLADKLSLYEGEPARTLARHAAWHAGLLEREARGVRGGDPEALAMVEAELDNVYAAWDWAMQAGELDTLGRMLEPLSSFLSVRAWYEAGERICRDAAARLEGMPESDEQRCLRARMVSRQAAFKYRLGERLATRTLLEESRAIQVKAGARRDLSFTLRHIALVANSQGARAEAMALHEEALALCREFGDRRMEAYVLGDMGIMAQSAGDYGLARDLHTKSLALHRAESNATGIISSLNCLGIVCRSSGDSRRAKAFLKESREASHRVGNLRGEMVAVMSLCNLAQDAGKTTDALQLVQEALVLSRDLGQQDMMSMCLCTYGNVLLELGQIDKALIALEESLRIRENLCATSEAAVSRTCLADALCLGGEFDRARTLYLESLDIFERDKDRWGLVSCLCGLCSTWLGLGDLAQAETLGRRAFAVLRGSGDRAHCSRALYEWARVLMARSQYRRAAQLWGCLQRHIPTERVVTARLLFGLEELNAKLSKQELDEALAAGRLQTPERFVDEFAEEESLSSPAG